MLSRPMLREKKAYTGHHFLTQQNFGIAAMRAPIIHDDPRYTSPERIYKIHACVPPRPPSPWWPKLFARDPIYASSPHIIRPRYTPIYENFTNKDLEHMDQKVVEIKSKHFPEEFRCKHIYNSARCDKRCYMLEKGGKGQRVCETPRCKGHIQQPFIYSHDGEICFGSNNTRIVRIV
ncbi:hypothetical protein DPSP01_014362 [Paraphaeosphaeria sporulosa]